MLVLAGCGSSRLPGFASQRWHVDPSTGHAVSTAGLEFGFGSEWMVTDTSLMQSAAQLAQYRRLEGFLADALAEFPEIVVDSVYFYNPHRGLLFAAYHQRVPLRPGTEVFLYNDSNNVYSKEYARRFGQVNTAIDVDGWENGPAGCAYTNVRYRPSKKQLVLLQRIPYRGSQVAVFQIRRTIPGRGKWWLDYPRGTFWTTDLGDTDNIDHIATFLHHTRTTAVANLALGLPR